MEDLNQVEHKHISTALEVEKLEENLFRSKCLWVPVRARGVFGGQVISQALVSATNCVNPAFGLHSLHCYFLDSASPATPIVYYVERLRQGRSYVACSVKAVQNGSIIFILMCSFQKPEPWQPSHHWKMPDVPGPDECELEEDRYALALKQDNLPPAMRDFFEEYRVSRAQSPIAVKIAKLKHVSVDGTDTTSLYWMQARSIPQYEAPFQKCILSYLSDLYLLGNASRALELKRFGKGRHGIGMNSTIDHSVHFYNDDFDCGKWLLYVMSSPRSGSGRGIVHGQLYSRDGTLVAITSQEGVVRADVRGPQTESGSVGAKL